MVKQLVFLDTVEHERIFHVQAKIGSQLMHGDGRFSQRWSRQTSYVALDKLTRVIYKFILTFGLIAS